MHFIISYYEKKRFVSIKVIFYTYTSNNHVVEFSYNNALYGRINL